MISGTINSTFSYDANGNLTGGNNRSLTWHAFNQPATITNGANAIGFLYDVDHGRMWQGLSASSGILYLDAFGVHSELLISATQSWNDYIVAGGAFVAMRAVSGATTATRYFHADNLGSIAVITDETGAVVPNGRQGYDAWGKRRWPSGADDTGNLPASQVTRGFTGEELLRVPGYVHLNGRLGACPRA